MLQTKPTKTQKSKRKSKKSRRALKKKKKKVIRSFKNINVLARKEKTSSLLKPQENSGNTKMKSKI